MILAAANGHESIFRIIYDFKDQMTDELYI